MWRSKNGKKNSERGFIRHIWPILVIRIFDCSVEKLLAFLQSDSSNRFCRRLLGLETIKMASSN